MKKLTEANFITAAKILNCEVAIIKAVAEVESAGNGFLKSGEPVILFEGHKFHKFTNGKFTTPENADISHRSWTSKYYKQNQHKRLQKAVALDRDAALMSASFGKFQIMGFNFKSCGFRTVQDFVTAMYKNENEHLLAFLKFVKTNRLDAYMRQKNWSSFARGYNGRNFAVNKYDTKLQKAYLKHSK